MIGEPYVRRTYNAFRSRYWPDANLPDFADLDFEFAEDPAEWGSVEWDENGVPCLSLDPSLRSDPRKLRAILLHEMAHLALGSHVGHGAQFYSEGMRVASLGAIRELF